MRVLPVLDLMGGVVVRGIAGRRAEYRAVVSTLTESSHPADVARAIRDRLGLTEFYVADLDAIAGSAPAFADYGALCRLGCRILVDAGVRDAAQAQRLADAAIDRVVVGLETISGPDEVACIMTQLGREHVLFSLDLREGKPLGDLGGWKDPDPEAIAREAIDVGVGALIVLDLARVGVGAGLGTEDLCRRLRQTLPHVEIIAGGGVRDADDLKRLEDAGVDAALVASALHDGRITREHLDRLS